MFRRSVLPTASAIVLALIASPALADSKKGTSRTLMDSERRVESFEDLGPSHRGIARVHRRHGYHHGIRQYRHHRGFSTRAWDGRYGSYPRRHFYLTGVSGYDIPGLVNVATVSYRTYVYYTPTYPSTSYGYPPYAYLHDLPAGPIYNKPCFC